MKLIANKQLTGDYGTVTAGQQFETNESVGNNLLKRGLAYLAEAPKIEYETRVIAPREVPEIKPQVPFRNVSVPNEEPEAVAPESNSKLPEPDVPKQATSNPGGWGGRAGSGSLPRSDPAHSSGRYKKHRREKKSWMQQS